MPHYEPWSEERARVVIEEFSHLEGPLMPMLHAVQETFGHVPDAIVPMLAEKLNVSRAEVHGVVTFYHDFRHEPAGQHVLKICRAEACQAAGGDALADYAERRLGCKLGETTADGRVTVEPIYCLGLCATAPSAMLDGKIVARLTERRLDNLIAEAQS